MWLETIGLGQQAILIADIRHEICCVTCSHTEVHLEFKYSSYVVNKIDVKWMTRSKTFDLVLYDYLPAKWWCHTVVTGSCYGCKCTSVPLVLRSDGFDRGSRQVKGEPVDLVMEDFDVSLYQRIESSKLKSEIVFDTSLCSLLFKSYNQLFGTYFLVIPNLRRFENRSGLL